MSSSFVKDCTDSSGTGAARGSKTFIIFVNNDSTATPPIEGQDLQNLLVNHGADPSNVSVLQMGQPTSDLDFDLPQLAGIEGLGGQVAPQVEPQSNFMVDNFCGDVGYAELPIDDDAIKKLESVLHTQEAKDILGDALLDMVNNPLSQTLPEQLPEGSLMDDGSASMNPRKSPKRRSQRQMDKAEREEVEKILAENQLMFQKEREEIRKAQQEKEEAEEKQRAECSVPLPQLNTQPSTTLALPAKISKGKTAPDPDPDKSTSPTVTSKGKSKPGPKNTAASGKGKTGPKTTTSASDKLAPTKPKGKVKKESVPAVSETGLVPVISKPEQYMPTKVENADDSLRLLKGVLKEVSVNLEKLEVKNLPHGIKGVEPEFDGFTTADNSNAAEKLRLSLSPTKSTADQKILVVNRGKKTENGATRASLSVQKVSPAVINKLKKITSANPSTKQEPKVEEQIPKEEVKSKKNIVNLKHIKKASKELFSNTTEKVKPKNTSLCPPISKSLMNYKIPHKNTHKAFYTSGYKKEVKVENPISPNKKDIPQKPTPRHTEERRKSKDSVNPTSPKKIVPSKVDSSVKVGLDRSVSLPIGFQLDSTPKHLNVAKSNPIKRPRPSFEVALNSSKEFETKPPKTIERSPNNPTKGPKPPAPAKMSFPIKTATFKVKNKPVIKMEFKDDKKVETKERKLSLHVAVKEPGVTGSAVRKSKRPAKKKQLDEEFVCLNEDVSSDSDISDDSLTEDDELSESEEGSDFSINDYDDPKRLWCICQKPHNHRFMICCDSCEDWFHGSCVGVTKSMGKVMEKKEVEWNCPRCKPPTKEEARRMKRHKAKLRKWSDDPKTNNQDPSEARVLVYEKSTGVVLSGNAAPTLNILQAWLASHEGFVPLLPSMMNSVITDPVTGLKSVKLSQSDDGTVTLSSEDTSPVKIQRKKDELREAKVSKSRDGGIIIKDTGYDYDPEFKPMKVKTPKKTILIDSIHPDRLTKSFQQEHQPKNQQPSSKHINSERFYRREQKKVKRISHEKNKHRRRENSHVATEMEEAKKPTPKSPKENIRSNVKKMLVDALSFRKSQVSEEFCDLSSEQLEDICSNIEEQLFVTFNKDVGFKYKSRYRSLVFNIRDPKNGGLYRQILSGTVSPSKLAKMTSEELASKELAEWRQRAEKKELEAIQKHELELLEMKTHFVMKTHKGEIEIDKDEFSKIKETAPEMINKLPEEVPSKAVEEETPDQLNHHNHIYDPDCSICIKMNIDTKLISPKKHTDKEESLRSKPKKHDRHKGGIESKHERRRDRSRDRHKRRLSEGDRESKHHRRRSADRRRSDAKSDRRSKDDSKRSSSDRHRNDGGKRRDSDHRINDSDERHIKRLKISDSKLIDLTSEVTPEGVVVSTSDDVVFLPTDDNTKDFRHVKDAEPTSTVVGTPIEPETYDDPLDILLPESPATPPLLPEATDLSPERPATPEMSDLDLEDGLLSPATPPLPDTGGQTPPPGAPANKSVLQPIWRGGINMQDVATFNAAAFEVSGKAHYFTGDVPTSIDIVGRINPDTVWSYITQMKKSGSKEILVIRFQPSSEEEKVSYIALYCYLSSKKRYGVIGNCEKSVKDFYIVPLAAHQPIPQVLLPLDGPGFEESRPHMLIGVVIRSKHRRIYDTQAGVWIDVGGPDPKRKEEPASESPTSVNDSPPPDFEEESYTPPQVIDTGDLDSIPSPPRKPSPSRDQFDMLAELNRQIEKDKAEISHMQKTFEQVMDHNTPPAEGESKPMDRIQLPSNLQDILDNIKQKEVGIKAKELEIERRLNLVSDEPSHTENPFGVPLAGSDVDLRVLIPQRPLTAPADEDLRSDRRLPPLVDITDEEAISKSNPFQPQCPPPSFEMVEPLFESNVTYPQPPLDHLRHQGPPIPTHTPMDDRRQPAPTSHIDGTFRPAPGPVGINDCHVAPKDIPCPRDENPHYLVDGPRMPHYNPNEPVRSQFHPGPGPNMLPPMDTPLRIGPPFGEPDLFNRPHAQDPYPGSNQSRRGGPYGPNHQPRPYYREPEDLPYGSFPQQEERFNRDLEQMDGSRYTDRRQPQQHPFRNNFKRRQGDFDYPRKGPRWNSNNREKRRRR